MDESKSLRLIAESPEDLEVISSAVQDSVVKAGNLKFEARQNRFALELNRFRWESPSGNDRQRVRSLLAFDGILSVKTRAISKVDPEMVLSLLQITFTPDAEPPGGKINLLFAGDGELELTAEVLDATLLDSDYAWPTRHLPDHEKPRKR